MRSILQQEYWKGASPFLYDPVQKEDLCQPAALGYEMWQKYSSHKRMPFRHDGVLEVALNDKGSTGSIVYGVGLENGLTKK